MKPIFNISGQQDLTEGEYLLVLKLGDRHAAFAVCNVGGNELYHLSYYSNGDMDETAVRSVVLDIRMLGAKFTAVKICYDHLPGMLLPSTRYDGKEAGVLLQELYGVNGLSGLHSESIEGWPVRNVYAVPKAIEEFLAGSFSNLSARHVHTIELKMIETTAPTILRVDFRTDEFSLLLLRDNQLLLSQTYFYTAPADVIYILLNACRQFEISQEEVRVKLSGLIEQDSALFREIYQYFLDVVFENVSWNAPSQQESNYPAHFFTSLNEVVLCAS